MKNNKIQGLNDSSKLKLEYQNQIFLSFTHF